MYYLNLSQVKTLSDLNKDTILTTEIQDRNSIYESRPPPSISHSRISYSQQFGFQTTRAESSTQFKPKKYKLLLS